MKKVQKIKMAFILGIMLIPSVTAAHTIGTVTADNLNIRKTPSMNGPVVTQAVYGDTLYMINEEKSAQGWYKIQLKNDVAYVKNDFVRILSFEGTTTENNLNFRSYPSLSGSKIMNKIPNGTPLTVFYRTGDFYKVLYKDTFGFVYADYVDVPFADRVPEQDLEMVQDVLASGQPETDIEIKQPDQSLKQDDQAFIWMDNTQGTAVSKEKGNRIVSYALQFVGNPYVYGGNDLLTGVDCSGYTQQVMKAFEISLPRTSKEQSKTGKLITDMSLLQPGDLLFFGSSPDDISHVGIYIEEGLMVHASTPETGIIISPVTSTGNTLSLQVMRRMVE